MSPLLVTLLSLAAILVLYRLKVPLSLAILAGSVALALMFEVPVRAFATAAGRSVTSVQAIGLMISLALLMVVSQVMDQTGQLRRIVDLAQAFLRRPAVTLAALPALIGLLPMPGGALFSAPLVASAAGRDAERGDLLSAINYWWRHIWESFWPLFPGVILATYFTGSDAVGFAKYLWPLTPIMMVAGLAILVRTHPELRTAGGPPPAGTKRRLAVATAPIWLVFGTYALLAGAAWALLGPPPRALPGLAPLTANEELIKTLRNLVPLAAGLMVSLLWLARARRVGPADLKRMKLPGKIAPLLALLLAIFIFQAVLKQAEAGQQIDAELKRWNVPIVFVVALLPMIAGLVTGIAFGFVGVSFPVVLKLVAELPGSPSMWPYVVLAFGCGHIGMMLSPVHVCHVVSNRYFKTRFLPVYRYLLPAAVVQAVGVTAYFLLLRYIL